MEQLLNNQTVVSRSNESRINNTLVILFALVMLGLLGL
jgi:hypothetical protein